MNIKYKLKEQHVNLSTLLTSMGWKLYPNSIERGLFLESSCLYFAKLILFEVIISFSKILATLLLRMFFLLLHTLWIKWIIALMLSTDLFSFNDCSLSRNSFDFYVLE